MSKLVEEGQSTPFYYAASIETKLATGEGTHTFPIFNIKMHQVVSRRMELFVSLSVPSRLAILWWANLKGVPNGRNVCSLTS